MILIIRRTVDYWEFDDSVNPQPVSCSGYSGLANGDNTITFTSENGQTKYNHVIYSEFEYVDEYGSNDYTPSSASDLMQFLISEGFFGDGSSSGGATTFIGLSDVTILGGYAANQGRIPIVDGSGLIMVTPSFAFQNNIGKWQNVGVAGTGEVTPAEISAFINANANFSVLETTTPVFVTAQRTESGLTRRFIFNFIAGKPPTGTLWGVGGTPTTAVQFRLVSILIVNPSDIENDPNTIIYPIGTVPIGDDFWEVANALPSPQTPFDLSDSGEIQPDGNPLVYYFSFTQDGVLYYAQFVGAQGLYGGIETPFVESDFVVTTNDTIGDTPNLQIVTDTGNTTTNPMVVYDETAAEGKISYGHNEIVFTDPSGNIIRLQFPMGIVEPEVTYEFPIKDANDTFVMISDISGGSAFDRRYLYTAGSNTDTFIITDLIDATAIQMISSNVGGNVMGSAVTFDSVTGEISGYPVLTGEEHLIYYTKP
jgi:hypothetical protein